jgi:DNA-3-methyladenine glycosylase
MSANLSRSPRQVLRPVRRAELPVDVEEQARWLIGKLLVRDLPEGRMTGRIVETESYPPGDASGHAFHGETAANHSLFREPGRAYIYLCYGVYWMCNVSAEPKGVGAGVLIRALEPLEGIELMEERRGTKVLRDLTRGPGRLAQALSIDRALDGVDMCKKGPLWLAQGDHETADPGVSIRIGITKEAHQLRRFYVRGSPYVSGSKTLNR